MDAKFSKGTKVNKGVGEIVQAKIKNILEAFSDPNIGWVSTWDLFLGQGKMCNQIVLTFWETSSISRLKWLTLKF